MSNPQGSSGGWGWTFWPSSDIYQLTPKWSEGKSISGKVLYPEEEPNRFSLKGRYNSEPSFFVIDLAQAESDDLLPPVGTPVFTSRIWLGHGFSESRQFAFETIMDSVTGLWNGEVKISTPTAVQKWMGVDRVAEFTVDFWLTQAPTEITRVAYGDLVFSM
ncbi:MAG: hypothetical protein H0V67_02555 [Geodermatophilaceae bacterium]|nr:hypothetical protein [Geodermatophilaceae bacterium]